MIIVKLQGGLGNQMFQYAAARSLLKKDKYVYLDHGFIEANNNHTDHFTARSYELHIFKNIKARRASAFQIAFFKSQQVICQLLRSTIERWCRIVEQEANEYIDLNKYKESRFFYLDGYFQSEKYFTNIRKDILNEFSLPALDPINEALRNKISLSKNPVSIHIRRGDYLNSEEVLSIHGVLPLSYYNTALGTLKKKYSNLSLFIFSDDIPWVKSQLLQTDLPIYFVDNNLNSDSWKDIALMSNCKHHIIANSSFSWWGAWLSDKTGEVFAPSNWFNPLQVKFEIRDFIPATWNIVKYE